MLTSASASTQTTILPDHAHVALDGGAPSDRSYFARIHPRYLTPSTSTIWVWVLSIVWYAALTVVSQNILFDSIAALGLMIAFYYGPLRVAPACGFSAGIAGGVKGVLLAGCCTAGRER